MLNHFYTENAEIENFCVTKNSWMIAKKVDMEIKIQNSV